VFVEEKLTSGDYLGGFPSTEQALTDSERQSVTISIRTITAFSIWPVITLVERAVCFYGILDTINAYHQPRFEVGKQAAVAALTLQTIVQRFLLVNPCTGFTAREITGSI